MICVMSPRDEAVLLCTCTTTGWLAYKDTADVSDCVTVRREVVPLSVSSVLLCPFGNYKPGQDCFPLFLFTDERGRVYAVPRAKRKSGRAAALPGRPRNTEQEDSRHRSPFSAVVEGQSRMGKV